MEWISVKDKLPNPEQKQYLVSYFINNRSIIKIAKWRAYIRLNKIVWSWHGQHPKTYLTHWMELPKVPII